MLIQGGGERGRVFRDEFFRCLCEDGMGGENGRGHATMDSAVGGEGKGRKRWLEGRKATGCNSA